MKTTNHHKTKYRTERSISALLIVASAISALFFNIKIALILGLFSVLILVPLLLRNYRIVHIPRVALWSLLIFSFCAIILGELGNFYEKYGWYDALLHFISAVLIGFVAVVPLMILARKHSIPAPFKLIVLFAIFATCTVGVIWEIFEHLVDMYFKTNMQPSLSDTMDDLALDLSGGIFGSILGAWTLEKVYKLRQEPGKADEVLVETIEENIQL